MLGPLNRREALGVLLAGAAGTVCGTPAAHASLAVGVTIQELLRKSSLVAFSTSLDASSRWEEMGGSRRIVTYNRMRFDELVAGEPAEPEMWVRTLGGRVGDVGQIVYGEAEPAVGEPCLLFIRPGHGGIPAVTGRAQGHYPLHRDPRGIARLTASPRLGTVLRMDGSAVKSLAGRSRAEAMKLLGEARRAK